MPPVPIAQERAPDVSERGGFSVQLASFQNEADAEAAAELLTSEDFSLASSQAIFVAAARLEQGVVYRLRTGPFSDLDEAESFCDELKARGRDCFVSR